MSLYIWIFCGWNFCQCPKNTYVSNCYCIPSRLFIIRDCELKSSESTTQGDPIAMAVYAIAIIPMILMLIETIGSKKDNKTAAYADDISTVGKVKTLRK